MRVRDGARNHNNLCTPSVPAVLERAQLSANIISQLPQICTACMYTVQYRDLVTPESTGMANQSPHVSQVGPDAPNWACCWGVLHQTAGCTCMFASIRTWSTAYPSRRDMVVHRLESSRIFSFTPALACTLFRIFPLTAATYLGVSCTRRA